MKRRRASLFLRLLLLTLPIELVVLALFGFWVIRGSERGALAAFDENARIRSREILGDTLEGTTGGIQVDPGLIRRSIVSGTRACVLDGERRVLWESPPGWFAASGLRPLSSPNAEYTETVDLGGTRFRVLDAARRIRRPGDGDVATGPLVEVLLATPLAGLEQAEWAFREKAFFMVLSLLLLTAVLLWGAIRTGLDPLRALVGKLEDVPGPDGSERVDADMLPPELRPLALEINGLSDRLWRLVQMERRFSAEAAHELRTPLTLVKSTLETALLTASDGADLEAALHEALEDLQRLERTADLLLELARADALPSSRPMDFEAIDLQRLLTGIADRFERASAERGIRIELDVRPSPVHGEREPLERLFANLVDNAVKHGRTDGHITLRCGRDGHTATASVENDGPRIPEKDRPHLFQPFFRGTEARAARVPGAGLGLSIVAAVARRYGAEVSYETTGREGNRFLVRFPAWAEEG